MPQDEPSHWLAGLAWDAAGCSRPAPCPHCHLVQPQCCHGNQDPSRDGCRESRKDENLKRMRNSSAPDAISRASWMLDGAGRRWRGGGAQKHRRWGQGEEGRNTVCRSRRGDGCSPISGRGCTLAPFMSTEGLVLLCVDNRSGCIRPAQESRCCVPNWLPPSLPRLLRPPG